MLPVTKSKQYKETKLTGLEFFPLRCPAILLVSVFSWYYVSSVLKIPLGTSLVVQ